MGMDLINNLIIVFKVILKMSFEFGLSFIGLVAVILFVNILITLRKNKLRHLLKRN